MLVRFEDKVFNLDKADLFFKSSQTCCGSRLFVIRFVFGLGDDFVDIDFHDQETRDIGFEDIIQSYANGHRFVEISSGDK